MNLGPDFLNSLSTLPLENLGYNSVDLPLQPSRFGRMRIWLRIIRPIDSESTLEILSQNKPSPEFLKCAFVQLRISCVRIDFVDDNELLDSIGMACVTGTIV